MPKVVFVNEHRVVEVPAGTHLKLILSEENVDPRHTKFRFYRCGIFGACAGCQVWVKPAGDAELPRRTWRERWAGMRGERRLSCQLPVHSDIEVTTMAATSDRVRVARPIAPPPHPTVEPEAKRKPIDAAPTAAFVYGHPSAVGSGRRTAPVDAAPAPVPAKVDAAAPSGVAEQTASSPTRDEAAR